MAVGTGALEAGDSSSAGGGGGAAPLGAAGVAGAVVGAVVAFCVLASYAAAKRSECMLQGAPAHPPRRPPAAPTALLCDAAARGALFGGSPALKLSQSGAPGASHYLQRQQLLQPLAVGVARQLLPAARLLSDAGPPARPAHSAPPACPPLAPPAAPCGGSGSASSSSSSGGGGGKGSGRVFEFYSAVAGLPGCSAGKGSIAELRLAQAARRSALQAATQGSGLPWRRTRFGDGKSLN